MPAFGISPNPFRLTAHI